MLSHSPYLYFPSLKGSIISAMSQSPPPAKADPLLVPVRTRYYRKDYSEVTGWRPAPRPHTDQQVQPTVTKPLAARSRREVNQFPRYPTWKAHSLLSVSAKGSPVRMETQFEQLKSREMLLDAEAPKQEAKVYLPVFRVTPTAHSAGHSHSKSDLHDAVLHIPSQPPLPAVQVSEPTVAKAQSNSDVQVSWGSHLPFSIPGQVYALQLDLRPLQKAALTAESPEADKPLRQSSPSAETSAGPETIVQFAGKEAAQGTETERYTEEDRAKATVSAERVHRANPIQRNSLIQKIFDSRSLHRSQSLIVMQPRLEAKGKFNRFLKGLISGNSEDKEEAVKYVKQELKASLLNPPVQTLPRRQSFDVSPPSEFLGQDPCFPLVERAVRVVNEQEVVRPETQELALTRPPFQPLVPIEAVLDNTDEPETPNFNQSAAPTSEKEEELPANRDEKMQPITTPSADTGPAQSRSNSFAFPREKEEHKLPYTHRGTVSPPAPALPSPSSALLSPPAPSQTPSPAPSQTAPLAQSQTAPLAQSPTPSLAQSPTASLSQSQVPPPVQSQAPPLNKAKRPQRRSLISQPTIRPAIKSLPRRSLLVRTRKARKELGSPAPVPLPIPADPSPPSLDSLQTDKDSEPDEPLPARDPMFRRGARRNSSLIQSDLQQNLTRLFTRRRSSLSGEVRALLEEPEDRQKLLKELPLVQVDVTRTTDSMEEFVLQFAKSLLVSLQQMDMGPEEEPKVPVNKEETPKITTLQSDTDLIEEGEKEAMSVQKSTADFIQPKITPRQSINRRRGSQIPMSRASLKSPQDSRSPSLLSPPLTPSKASVPSLPSDLSLASTPRRSAPRKSAQLSSVPRRSMLHRASISSKRPKPGVANISSASEEAEDEVPGSEEDPSPVRNYLAGSADFELKHMEMVKKMAEELLVGRKRRVRFYNIALDEAEQKQKDAEDVVTSEEETPIPHTPCITYDVKWQKEAEENDLREDVAEKLAALVQSETGTLHDFAFSTKINFDFQAPVELGKDRISKNSDDTDKPDEAGMVSAMLREQFYERCKAKTHLEEGGNTLEVIDSGAQSRAERYALFRRDLEKRIKKEKILRSRSGQEMAKLHAKPLSSFTNLPLPLPTAPKHLRNSRSDQLLLDGKASQVQSPRERQERVYLRIKGESDLQRLSRCDNRPYHYKAVSFGVAQLGEIGARPSSVR